MKLAVCLFLNVFLLCLGQISSADPQQIRFSTVAPEGTSWANEIFAFAKEIEQKTHGEVTVKVYASSKMGDELDSLRKMRSGQLHAGAFSGIGLGVAYSGIRMLEQPFLFHGPDEVDYVMEKLYPKLAKRFDEKGMILGSITDLGEYYIFTKNPVRTAADSFNNKLWIWEGDLMTAEMLKVGKVTPVPLPITDVLTALHTGMVTGIFMPPLAAIGFQWWTKLNYQSFPAMGNAVGAILITKKEFQKMSPQNQKIFMETTRTTGRKVTLVSREDNRKAIDTLAKNGIKRVDLTEDGIKNFKEMAMIGRKNLIGTVFDAELVADMDAAIAEYRSRSGASAAAPTAVTHAKSK